MADTSFIETPRFPEFISWGSIGGPMWNTDVAEKASGSEERNSPWAMPKYSFDAKYGVRTVAEIYEIVKLFNNAHGRLRGFRFKDWSDYRSGAPNVQPTATDQVLGTGDGTTTAFPLNKIYTYGSQTFTRRISKPVAGTILVADNGSQLGSGFSVDTVQGIVNFTAPPVGGHALTWGGEFDTPVRFDSDKLDITLRGPIQDIPSIPLVELRFA